MSRRTGSIALVAGAVLVVLGAVVALDWRDMAFAVGAILYRGPGPPAIAAGLVGPERDPAWTRETSEKVTNRLRLRFPPGSNDEALRTFLQQQGFRPTSDFMPADAATQKPERLMMYYWGGPVCTSQLWIEWHIAQDRKLTGIEASYNYVCI